MSSHQSLSSSLTAKPGRHLTFLTVGQRQLLEGAGGLGPEPPGPALSIPELGP